MTTNHATRTYNMKHTTFGGEVSQEDFNTSFPDKNRLNRQINDERFEQSLSENSRRRKETEKYREMTLEELKEMKLISNANGRPSSSLTDERWQKEFHIRKLFVEPYAANIKKLGGKYSKEPGTWDAETQGAYYGKTNWQEYCSFINDVLLNIRGGQIDYCYYICQILDLLKFHHDDLRTKYCDGYWEVWLEP